MEMRPPKKTPKRPNAKKHPNVHAPKHHKNALPYTYGAR